MIFFCVGVMYSDEYDVCDVTLSVCPHRASLKNMPATVGIQPTTFGILALVAPLAEHWASIPMVVGSIPTVACIFSSLPGVDIHSE